MANVESKSFDQPDETKELPKTRIDLVDLAGGQVQRSTLEPGWRWTGSVGPAVNADRCPVNHIAYSRRGVYTRSTTTAARASSRRARSSTSHPDTTPESSATSRSC